MRPLHYIESLKAFPMSSPGCKVHNGVFLHAVWCNMHPYFSTFISHHYVFKNNRRVFSNATQPGMSKQLAQLTRTCAKGWAQWLSLMVLWVCPFHTPWQLSDTVTGGALTKLFAAHWHSETSRHCTISTCMGGVAELCWHTAPREYLHLWLSAALHRIMRQGPAEGEGHKQ